MKRLILSSLIVVLFMSYTTVHAAEKAVLGCRNIAIKVDYINFTNDVVENNDIDTGAYVSLEGFRKITPNFYLGVEIGYANPEGSVNFLGTNLDTELTLVPVEVNVKYAMKTAPNFCIDFGAGLSYNYVEEKKPAASGVVATVDDWLFGGQLFADLNYTYNTFFIGINAKYQITEDFENFTYDYSNWRIGGQVGFMF